jgi:hypothetical protein
VVLANLAELQLWYNGYNVAQGKPATAANAYANLPQYAAPKITDGLSNTFYSSFTFSDGTYVMVDLLVRRRRGGRRAGWLTGWRGWCVCRPGHGMARLLLLLLLLLVVLVAASAVLRTHVMPWPAL